jgi:broad specificity phosphatase PhoE
MRLQAISALVAMLAGFPVCASGAQFPITVVLVRHAERAADPPDDPVLSDTGKRRAQALDAVLSSASITALYASEATRTQLTLKPLADRLHLPINHTFTAAQPKELAQAILKGKDRVVVVASHSNRLPQIIQALRGGTVPPIDDTWEFDNLYVVTIYGAGKANTLRLHYGERSTPAAATLGMGGGHNMRITLGRSGGLVAAPGLAIEATVDLSDGQGRVTEAASNYAHNLSASEAQKLRGQIDSTCFFKLPAETRSPSVADQYQYDITVRLDDGRTHSIKTSDTMSDKLEKLCPGLGKFLDWTTEEFDRIMHHRMQQD